MIRKLIYNEYYKVKKKKRAYIGFILILILVPFIVGAIENGGTALERAIYGQLSDSFFFVGSILNGYLASYVIVAILINHMPFLSTIIAADIFSGEYSKSTFRLYLTRPISRSKVLISKLLIVIGYTTLLIGFFFGYSLLISTLWLGTGELAVFDKGLLFLNKEDVIYRFIIAFFTANIVMVTVSLLCFLISTISRNSVTPIIVTISAVFIGTAISLIPIDLFEKIDPYLFTGYINSFLVAFYEPIPWAKLNSLFWVCFTWSTIFILASFYFFLNQDILD